MKINLEFFEYYRFFVDHFAIIVKFLIKFKIRKFVNESIKNKSKREHAIRMRLQQKVKKIRNFSKKLNANDECRRIWKKLKEKFCFAFILIYSNFSKSFIFYVNENKKKDFDAILHQISWIVHWLIVNWLIN